MKSNAANNPAIQRGFLFVGYGPEASGFRLFVTIPHQHRRHLCPGRIALRLQRRQYFFQTHNRFPSCELHSLSEQKAPFKKAHRRTGLFPQVWCAV